jgi:hypothetical protein
MNRDAALRHLSEYCELVKQAQRHPVLSKERRATMKAVNNLLPGVNHYLRSMAPDFELISAHYLGEHVDAQPSARRAIGLLTDSDDMTSHQWSCGGPTLPLSVLDPMVYGPAEPLWAGGKYRQAVGDAASNVNHFTQHRLGRHDVSDSDLMAQAFGEKDPEEGKPRLRCPGDQDSMTVRSMQHGAMFMAMGVFQAIRNPAVHLTGDWNPVTAAEHLAALSIVARWVRHWEVVRYVPPSPDFEKLRALTEAQYQIMIKQSSK